MRRVPSFRSAFESALFGGLALLAACGPGAPDWSKETPARVDDAAAAELLRPHGREELVLANFWATW
jgi:hypothetical protein